MFQRGSIEAGVVLEPCEEIMDLLHTMTVGSGGARYLHKNIDERMSQLPNKYFMYLKKNKTIKGVFVSAQRTISEDFGLANAYYIRYLAIDEMFQTIKEKRIKPGNPNGIIKGLTKKFLSDAPIKLGIGYDEDESLPSFHYAFFDSENFRSTGISQLLGMNPIGDFSTFRFTRMKPKSNNHIEKLGETDFQMMKKKLSNQYASFSIYTDQYLYSNSDYYVWKENGEIVAGVQPNKCEWEVKQMGGFSGVMMVKILPKVPLLKKYVNPKKFEFLTLDYLYVVKGHEDKLELLLEGMLHEYNVFFSLIFQDLKSPFTRILNDMNMGLLSHFSNVPDGKIMMTVNNVSDSQKEKITKKPIFTCGVDMS
jgi:hypothetical protein